MTEEEKLNELKEVVKWNNVSGDKVVRIYALNRFIFNDNANHCQKCPDVIRNIFNKVKKYYLDNYGKESN